MSFDDYNEIEQLQNAVYTNSLEEDAQIHVVCQRCGEYLYDGDIYYPELGVCEYCLMDYKKVVDIPLIEDEMTLAHRLMEED